MTTQRGDAVWAAAYVARLMNPEPMDVDLPYMRRAENATDTADAVLGMLEEVMESRDRLAHRAHDPRGAPV